MIIHIDEALSARVSGVALAWALYENVRVAESPPALLDVLETEQRRVQDSMTIDAVAQDPAVGLARRVFKTLGLDPARYRPSQEALLRRILKGQPLTPINAAVDVCNGLSVRWRLAMGMYDADRVTGEPVLRLATSADRYAALNGREVECPGLPVLVDREGPIGSPYVDSRRSAVTTACRRCLHVVYFCPVTLGEESFRDMMDTVSSFLNATAKPYRLIRL